MSQDQAQLSKGGAPSTPSDSEPSSRKVQVVGAPPPAPTLSRKDVDESDSDDDDQTQQPEEEEDDAQTDDDEAQPEQNGPSDGLVTRYGSVSVANAPINGQVSEAPSDQIPDDEELLADFSDSEEVIDLTHLRLTTTKNLNLPRFSKNLKKLCLRQNLISKIRSKDIGVLTELRELDLYDNGIEKISGLENLTKIESLDLSFNNIHHITNVSHLGNCSTIYFVQNRISKVRQDDLRGPIADRLTSLELGGNRIRSIENIDHLTKLKELWLGKNKITSLQGLGSLVNLKILSIQSNRITKIEGLENLVNLEEFYISHNGISKLEGLENNTKLRTLDIGANRIEKVENISHLTNLEEFWASGNKIENLNELESELGPSKMPNLETVYLEGNPAQRSEGAAYRRKVKLLLPQIRQIDATYIR